MPSSPKMKLLRAAKFLSAVVQHDQPNFGVLGEAIFFYFPDLLKCGRISRPSFGFVSTLALLSKLLHENTAQSRTDSVYMTGQT